MNISITESVVCSEAPESVWPRLLEASAVTGFLGVADDVRPYRPEVPSAEGASDDDEFTHGHTFRIVGLGGGVYHAAYEEIEEPARLSYSIWRDDTPDKVALLTFDLGVADDATTLTLQFTMEMPLEALFGAYGSFAMPVVEPMVHGYLAYRLRGHLRSIAPAA